MRQYWNKEPGPIPGTERAYVMIVLVVIIATSLGLWSLLD